jgi:hypothetical protein
VSTTLATPSARPTEHGTEPDSNGHVAVDADLLAALRELVAEPDMSEAEIEALVADALAEMGWHPEAPLRAQPCRCLRRLVFRPGSTCHWCGRSPHAPGGERYMEPVEWVGQRWERVRLPSYCDHGQESRRCPICERERSRRRREAAR